MGTVDMARLKDFLNCCSYLYPEKPYFNPKVYKGPGTSKQLMGLLFPQFVNFIHYYLLEDIVETFGCNVAKEVLQQFTDQNYDHKRKSNIYLTPLLVGKLNSFMVQLKVQVEGNATVVIGKV